MEEFRRTWNILLVFVIVLECSCFVIGNKNDDYVDHRISWLEESVRTFVYETQPEIISIVNELASVKEENKAMKKQIHEQQTAIHDLEWAAYDIQGRTLTKEERDVVTQLKWTIFDLKAANEELQEESCRRDTKCKEWSEWSHCSVSCGMGTRIRNRFCENTGKFSSMCKMVPIQEEACNERNCTPALNFPQLDCQEGYENYQGFCFRFSGRQDTRLLSTILCEDEGGHLVLAEDDVKAKIIWDYLNIVAPAHMVDMHEDFSKREFWDFQDIERKTNVAIDGIRKHQLAYFQSYRDQEMTYFNWAKGQPRNSQSDGDYCVTLNVLTGEWYMSCCSVTFFYVCESEKRTGGGLTIGN